MRHPQPAARRPAAAKILQNKRSKSPSELAKYPLPRNKLEESIQAIPPALREGASDALLAVELAHAHPY